MLAHVGCTSGLTDKLYLYMFNTSQPRSFFPFGAGSYCVALTSRELTDVTLFYLQSAKIEDMSHHAWHHLFIFSS